MALATMEQAAKEGQQLPAQFEENPKDSVAMLERHRLACESDDRYHEAETARLKLRALCSAEQDSRRETLRTRQLSERKGIEEAHMKELEDFNFTWDAKVQEYEAHSQKLLSTLAERNKMEHEAYMEKLRIEVEPRTPRFSGDLLRIRKMQATLKKQKKYPEAAEAKVEADRMQVKEEAVWQGERERKIAALEKQYLQKQRMEMTGLMKRIQSGREEQSQARTIELNRILQRYVNVKNQLETHQKLTLQRLDKYPVTAKELAQKSRSKMGSPMSSPRLIQQGAMGA